jgi:hypothetical protein
MGSHGSGPEEFNRLYGVVVGGDGSVVVSDCLNHRIQVLQ